MSEQHELAECVFDVDYMTQVLNQTDLVIHKRKVQAARYRNVRTTLVILFSIFAGIGVLLAFLLIVVFPQVLIDYPSDISFTEYEHCLITACPRANFIFEYLGGGKSCNFRQKIASDGSASNEKSFGHRRSHVVIQTLRDSPHSTGRTRLRREQYLQSLVGKPVHALIFNVKDLSALGVQHSSARRVARHESSGINPWVAQKARRRADDDRKLDETAKNTTERETDVQRRLALDEVHMARKTAKNTKDKGTSTGGTKIIPITIRRDLRSLTYLCLWTQLLVLLIGPKVAKVMKKSYEYFVPPERRPLLCVKKIIIETRKPENAINNDVPHVSPTEPVVLRSRMYGGYLSAHVHYAHTRGKVLDTGAQWHIVPAAHRMEEIRVKSRVYLRNDQGYLYVEEGKITLVPDVTGATIFVVHARFVEDNGPISYQCTVSFRCVMNDSFLKSTSSGGLALQGAVEASYFTVTRGGPYIVPLNDGGHNACPVVMSVEQQGMGYLTVGAGAELTLERTRTPHAHWYVRAVKGPQGDRDEMLLNERVVEIEPMVRAGDSISKPWTFTVIDGAAGEAEPLRVTAECTLRADDDKLLTRNSRERPVALAPRVIMLPRGHAASLSQQLWCFRVLSPADICADNEQIKVNRKISAQRAALHSCSLTLRELWNKMNVVHIPGVEAPWNPDDACNKVCGPLVPFRANTFVAPRRSDQWIAICAKRALDGDASEWLTVLACAARAGATGVILNCAFYAVDPDEVGAHSECSRVPCVFVEDDEAFEELCVTGRVVQEMVRGGLEESEKDRRAMDAGVHVCDAREDESASESVSSECHSEEVVQPRTRGSSSGSKSKKKHIDDAIERDPNFKAGGMAQDAPRQHSVAGAAACASRQAVQTKLPMSPDTFRSSLFARECHPLRPSIDHLGRSVDRRVRFGTGGRKATVRAEGSCIMDGDLSSLAPRVAEKNQLLLSPLRTPESGAARKPNERYADFKVEYDIEEITRHDSDMDGSVYDMNGTVIKRAVLPLLEFYVSIFLFVTSTIILLCILRLGLGTPCWSAGRTLTLACHVEFA